MGKVNKRFLQTLKKVRNDISKLNPDDRNAIARVDTALKKAIPKIPEGMSGVVELLNLCLKGLQAVNEGTVTDPRGLVDAVSGAVAAAEEFLIDKPGSELLISEAGQELIDTITQAGVSVEEQQSGYLLPAGIGIDLLKDFIIESREYIEGAEAALLSLETDPENTEVINTIFRSFHTIKGASSLLGFDIISGLAHHSESLLSRIRAHEICCTGGYANLALRSIDMLKELIQAVHDAMGGKPIPKPGGYDDLMRLLANPEEAGISGESGKAITQGSVSAPDHTIAQGDSAIEGGMDAIGENKQKEISALSHESVQDQILEQATEDQQSGYLPVDTDLLGEFITESLEYIEGAEAAFLSLETNPEDAEAINIIFRSFHTIKGASSFLGLTLVSEFAHRAESLLSSIRDHEIRCTGRYADITLRSIDMIKELMQGSQDALAGKPMARPGGYDDLMRLLADSEVAGIPGESNKVTGTPPRPGNILVTEGKAGCEEIEATATDQGKEPIGPAIMGAKTASLTDIGQAPRTQQHTVESSVRVRTDRLDCLIDMVGELVIAQSIVAQDKTVVHEGRHELMKKVSHTGKIVRELQDLSMSMRMVQLKATFHKMTRVVRDIAHKSGKIVNFITDGEETEIDRNMVDLINDPLVHMVRNSVDHGIEMSDIREKNGKPGTGTVRLSAYHSGGSVVVEIQDDGKGLNRGKIIEKAIAKGLIDSDKGMPDNEVFNLIFEPGFSTAEKVTDVSGRGVGLDVVKRGVEALSGRIDIFSEAGRGCTFSIRLPLTLAITDGMLVKVGAQRYIVPTIKIYMSFRPDADTLSTVAGRGEMVILRKDLIPVFRLYRLFNIKEAIEDPTRGLLMIVDDVDRRCALLVDELIGQQQVVAKTLGHGIGKVQGISGGAILGDGRVGLIIDPSEIAAMAREEGFRDR